MIEKERDELLIRLDERLKALSGWTVEHTELHKTQRASVNRWLMASFSLIGGLVVRLIFWKN